MDRLETMLKTIKRIKETSDGQEFITYLKELSEDNYRAFKHDSSTFNDIHKGYALAIDSLLDVFDNCEISLAKLETSDKIGKEQELPEAAMHY